MNETPPEYNPREMLTIRRVAITYGVMGAAGWGGAVWWSERSPWVFPEGIEVATWQQAAIGIGVATLTIVIDLFLERTFTLFREMGQAFREMLRGMTLFEAAFFAAASSVGEELLFRGWLHPMWGLIASSIVFGLLHIAPDKRMWPWPIFAVVMGFAFGGLFEYTGSLLAPILAHFTINYFGFARLAQQESRPSSD